MLLCSQKSHLPYAKFLNHMRDFLYRFSQKYDLPRHSTLKIFLQKELTWLWLYQKIFFKAHTSRQNIKKLNTKNHTPHFLTNSLFPPQKYTYLKVSAGKQHNYAIKYFVLLVTGNTAGKHSAKKSDECLL